MAGYFGPFTWSGAGVETLSSAERVTGIGVQITTLATGSRLSTDSGNPRIYRQGWFERCLDLSAISITPALCEGPTFIEEDNFVATFNPDAGALVSEIHYAIGDGGEVQAWVFYS